MKNNTNFILEWGVWANLDLKKEIELIVLKGHLFTEMIINSTLKLNNIKHDDRYSFYKKIHLLEKINFNDDIKKTVIINSLLRLNSIRNKLAHEVDYKLDTEIKEWSKNILSNLDGTKFSKYTNRTKIVQAFSTLSINILELTNSNDLEI